MKPTDSPDLRVVEFLYDWRCLWSAKKRGSSNGILKSAPDFEQQEKIARRLKRKHFTSESLSGEVIGGILSSGPPDHDISSEKFIKTEIKCDTATVEVRVGSSVYTFYVFHLRREGGSWLVAQVKTYFASEGDRPFSHGDREAILERVSDDAELVDLDLGVEPNCACLFENGKLVNVNQSVSELKVRRVGAIRLSSGAVGVFDFSWAGDFRPLHRRVPPGDYLVEVSMVNGTVVAVRIIFDCQRVETAWRSAVALDSNSHIVGVDHGKIWIFDAASYMALDTRQQDDKYEEGVIRGLQALSRGATFVHLGSSEDEAPDCVAVDSGYGDGAYPCYWGVDDSGVIVSLAVDFLIVAEFLTEVVSVPWSSEQLGELVQHPILKKYDLRVALESGEEEIGFKVQGNGFESGSLLSSSGAVICDSEGGGLMTSEDYDFYFVGVPLEGIKDAVLEIKVSTGYRNRLP